MTHKYIQLGWATYRAMVIPKDAPEIQIRETRRAFFAGASILFTTIILALDSDTEPTDEDMQCMTDLQTEIDAFGQELDRDLFKLTTH